MDITTEVSMADFDQQFDEYEEFGELGDDMMQSTEMIEMEIGKQNFEQSFAFGHDD